MDSQIDMFMDSKQHRELDGIDGEPMEFEWMIFRGFTTLQVLFEIQKKMKDLDCEPEQFQGIIIHVGVRRHRTVRSAQRTSMSY